MRIGAYRGDMAISRPVVGPRARRGRGRRAALSVVVAGALFAAGVVAGGPAGAASGGRAAATEYYVALGDSLAAGVGADPGKGYVDDVYAKEKKKLHGLVLENLSCSGATTTSMIDGPGCSYTTGSQLGDAEAFLEAHAGQVAFVSIDIGANDVVGCTDTSTLTIDQDCVNQGMETIGNNLPVILSGLRSAGGSTPIVGMSYYDPFLAAWILGSAAGKSLAEQSVTLLANLNSLLESDYATADTAAVADAFDSSDFSPGGHYEGTAVPVNVGRICHWTLMCSEENIHADDLGHAHIATAFEGVLGPVVDSHRDSTFRGSGARVGG
jgi:lysophospholipase L1-like esterase